MRICNACRYCEGFCAVFPALERRVTFAPPVLEYLANLCHDCAECYYSCQYAPPHEFELNLPRLFARLRQESYRMHAWPGLVAGIFRRRWFALACAFIAGPALLLAGMILQSGSPALFARHAPAEGAYYRVMSYSAMTGTFGLVGIAVLVALGIGSWRFWSRTGAYRISEPGLRDYGRALWDSLRLRYLDGGGGGCAYPDEVPSVSRRRFHHATFYGFLFCFLATTAAAFHHHVLDRPGPYPLQSIPAVLGLIGGLGLLIGPAGLLWLKSTRNPKLDDGNDNGMDFEFLTLLFWSGLSGFLLRFLRESTWMSLLLALHLGAVLGLFLTMPYGKFVHGIYRAASLARYASETRRPLN